MTVPNELLGKWNLLKSGGDLTNIAERLGVARQTISMAFNSGECSDEVFKAIADYYKEKEEMVASYLNDNND